MPPLALLIGVGAGVVRDRWQARATLPALGVAIAVERYMYLSYAALRNRSLWNEVAPLLSQGNFRQAVQVTSKSNAAIGQILSYGLARIQSARRRDDIEKAMEESLMEAMPKLERRTHYLASFANIATLLGLQHEAAAAVEVNAAGRAVGQRHRFLEDIGVGSLVGRGWIGAVHLQHVAQLGEERLAVGALGRAGGTPARDEGGNEGRLVGHNYSV